VPRLPMYANNFHPSMALIMGIENSQLLLLLNWMSPAFPIGAYAYSHGLEWAIESGQVKTAQQVEDWIRDVITRGSGWNDAILFVQEFQNKNVNELALALCSSRERHLETTQLGAAFVIAASIFAPFETVKDEIAYPIAAARACNAMQLDVHHALLAFLQGFSNALVSVAVRLVPIGQTAGLHIMKNLMPIISETAHRASAASLEDLGSCTLLSDIAAMKHETQHSRIFRT
jgi:urease accessory protein